MAARLLPVTTCANPASVEALTKHFDQLREDRPDFRRRWDLLEEYVERVRAKQFEAFLTTTYVRISDPGHPVSPAYANHAGKIDINLPKTSTEHLLTLPFMQLKDPVTQQRAKTTHWWSVNLRKAEELGKTEKALKAAVKLTRLAAEWQRNGRPS
ncbi:hypothetical protein ACFWBC_05735 [Streptomyces sp. NPDC059985]|uniref:hypothetical protein n=1 Tax=Streptomyces sp. NPDC059985 TaxID=3347025 RepID=UPI0036CBBEFD